MAEGLVGGALVRGLDDDGLPAGVSAPEEQDHLACLHNLPHLGIWKQMLCFSDIDAVSGWVDNHNDDKTQFICPSWP